LTAKVFRVHHGISVGNTEFYAYQAKVGINTATLTYNLNIIGTDGILVPVGNTGQRPTGANGVFRYNSETNAFEGYANGAWGAIGGSSGSHTHDAADIVSGTIDDARLPKANSTANGILMVLDSVTNTSILIAASANSVKNAYDRAIAANTRAASAQTAAIAAHSNAVSDAATSAASLYLPLAGGTLTGSVLPSSNSITAGNTTNRFIIWGAAGTFSGSVTSGTGFFPESNTVGQVLGALAQRFNLFANAVTTSNGIFCDSNTSGTSLGASTARFILNANTGNFSGDITPTANGTNLGGESARFNLLGNAVTTSNGLYCVSNTVGATLGQTTARFYLYGNVADFSSTVTSSGGFFPASNTVGQTLGSTTARFVVVANTGNFSGAITSSGGVNPESNTVGTALGATTARWELTGNNASLSGGLGVGTSASATAGEIRATNNITAYYSDKRLKKDISRIDAALNKVLSISGVYYTQNKVAEKFGYHNYSRQVGVIAQEIEKVLPEAVKLAPFDIEDVDGNSVSKSGENYLTVQYEKLIPLLIEAIKELSLKVEYLESKFKW